MHITDHLPRSKERPRPELAAKQFSSLSSGWLRPAGMAAQNANRIPAALYLLHGCFKATSGPLSTIAFMSASIFQEQ